MTRMKLLLIPLSVTFMTFPAAQSQPKPDVKAQNILAHVRFLADDLLEGRLPGSRGGDLAAQYVATQFEIAGLKPGNGDSYYQMVPMVGINGDPAMRLAISGKAQSRQLNYLKDFVAVAGVHEEKVSLDNRELIFVGYGITAPEVPWNDYKGTDVRGKVLLMLVNDPPSADPKFFGGKALTYYGRWTYKYEEAARQGATGAILIHNTEMAGYPWQVVEGSWSGEQFALPLEEPKTSVVEAWIQEHRADELFKSIGLSFEKARQLAAQADFKPIPMGMNVSIDIQSKVRRVESPNVIGKLEGADPKLKDEVILITSHYDHLGIGLEVNGDRIYNGAYDNASGTAGIIELARALEAYPERPRRSILFVAVTAEEQGLLGSEYYAAHPLVPLAQTAANINVDGITVWGRTENIVPMGAERSTIDAVVQRVGKKMNMVLSPDPFPEKGYFFRSDQFNLVKVGVPAVYFRPGLRFIGKPENWGEEWQNEYTAKHYHQPSDELNPQWTFEGGAQMMEFAFGTAFHLAIQDEMPQWRPGDPFEAIRKKTLNAVPSR